MQRRTCPRSRRLLHQTTTPTPATAAGGKHVWGIPSGSSKDGANPVTKESIFNNRTDHGTDIVEESIRRSKVGNEGTRGVTSLSPHPKLPREFYKPRGNSTVSTDRMPPSYVRRFPFSFISLNRVFWPGFGTKQVGSGWRAPAHKREGALDRKSFWLRCVI